MLLRLMELHNEISALIADLTRATESAVPDPILLTHLRWRLSRASRARTRYIDEEVHPYLLQHLPLANRTPLTALRNANVALLERSREHLRAWSTECVLARWDDYRVAAAVMLESMRVRVAAEKRVLHPLVRLAESAGGALEVDMSGRALAQRPTSQ